MAGHGRHLLHTDPAIEKFGYFRENMSLYYKVNLKSTSMALLYLAVIPVTLMYVSYKTEGINIIGKRRDRPAYDHNYVPRT
ncbi:hypothetical protein CANARDRAFT_26265 [[Candida] arabinofermentans NRRL YB-2248]|uniref:NADH dehydrogenase [ubiquinone] 1 beta subcomplex subunit 4 n=1 Tax=[Candida] arabinofermentans NRRL YB-2248 TaxID=983967 RepID=A0A1E4T8P4_9ASCO|nr:hypothetical protein CANARDRAFT_26265 [[Candida] arabinofermentans NRRL YB-2248]